MQLGEWLLCGIDIMWVLNKWRSEDPEAKHDGLYEIAKQLVYPICW